MTTIMGHRSLVRCVALALATSLAACGTTSDPSGSGGSNALAGSGNQAGASNGGAGGTLSSAGTTGILGGAGGSTASAGGVGGGAATCNADSEPLKTGTAKLDAYDCAIIAVAAKHGMPDPMIVKAQIQQESDFEIFAISGDSPCGDKAGWTPAESKSFGLIQTTPACGEAKSALLPDGHPNLSQDMTSELWKTSVFNPPINLDEGVKTDADSRKALQIKYPGCTDAQYNMMAAGAFNSGTNAVLGCALFNPRAQSYVDAITGHYHGFAASAGWKDPY